ncbi:hypothetical protein EVAR_22962_1 [Eumeta japonica]|uniref:Uncharacterized protein n=1 Tax=Eumeta variegata TaxID=151549 RepID=A0A4C1UQ95_EUMVA|nr:hypothetical protein EVAR_22962_1 [Eumeta japonica]
MGPLLSRSRRPEPAPATQMKLKGDPLSSIMGINPTGIDTVALKGLYFEPPHRSSAIRLQLKTVITIYDTESEKVLFEEQNERSSFGLSAASGGRAAAREAPQAAKLRLDAAAFVPPRRVPTPLTGLVRFRRVLSLLRDLPHGRAENVAVSDYTVLSYLNLWSRQSDPTFQVLPYDYTQIISIKTELSRRTNTRRPPTRRAGRSRSRLPRTMALKAPKQTSSLCAVCGADGVLLPSSR